MLCTWVFLKKFVFSFNWMLRVLEKELHKTIINWWWVHRDGSFFQTWILCCVKSYIANMECRALCPCILCASLLCPAQASSRAPCWCGAGTWTSGWGWGATAEMLPHREHRAGRGGHRDSAQGSSGCSIQSGIQQFRSGFVDEQVNLGTAASGFCSLYKKSQVTEVESNQKQL